VACSAMPSPENFRNFSRVYNPNTTRSNLSTSACN
jgi:hypothetical protein